MSAEAATAVLTSGIVMMVPLLFAALGELYAERAGVINVGLEGMMLVGALAGVTGAFYTGSPWIGVLSGAGGGLLTAALFAGVVVTRAADQVVAGTAVNLMALGATGAAYRSLSEQASVPLVAPSFPELAAPGLSRLPVVGEALFQRNALVYLAWLLIPLSVLLLFHTRWGLKLRAVGESPAAADTMGVDVARVRWEALLICGGLAGLGGMYLSIGHVRTFSEDMIAGRGFIALAVVIFGRWTPWGIAGAALLFGLAQGLSYSFQALDLRVPYQLFLALPYVMTLAVLVLRQGRSAAPAALAQPYRRS